MSAVSLGKGAYLRLAGRSAPIRMYNMYLEADPLNEVDGLVRLQRPGLEPYLTLGNGPMRGIKFRSANDSAYFVVMGTQFYKGNGGVNTLLGILPDPSDLVPMAISATRVIAIASAHAYTYTEGGTLTTVAMPDSRDVYDVAYLNGFFLLAQRHENRVYWISPGEADPDPLNFFSAEYDPDAITAIRAFGEEIWIFGSRGVEVWGMTGDPDAPFQRIPGRVISQGSVTRDAIVQINDILIWPTPDCQVLAWSGGLKVISNNGISERLDPGATVNPFLNVGQVKAWAYSKEGHTNYVCTSLEGTFVYDFSSGEWSEYGTTGRFGWQAHLGQNTDYGILAGDDTTNQIWRLNAEISNDDGEPITREISGGVTILGKPIANASLEIRLATGWAGDLVEGPDLLYRYSDDEGNTWTDWDTESLGTTGQYGGLVTIRRQGLIEAPGRIYELRYTADSPFRVNYARIGEATGSKPGRASI